MNELNTEKLEIIKSIEFNANSIQSLESSLPPVTANIADSPQSDPTKDAKIAQLERTIISLETKIDATDAYERRDSIIISGAVPPVSREENSSLVAIEVLKQKLGDVDIEPKDISVAHRLQTKPNAQGSSPRPPNIYVKLVRRDLKKQLIAASKRQDRNSQGRIFLNDSLTPTRTAIFRTLQRFRREHDAVKGVSSMEGEVFAYTAATDDQGTRPRDDRPPRNLRHRVSTKEQLRDFCNTFIKRPLEDFVVSWPRL